MKIKTYLIGFEKKMLNHYQGIFSKQQRTWSKRCPYYRLYRAVQIS